MVIVIAGSLIINLIMSVAEEGLKKSRQYDAISRKNAVNDHRPPLLYFRSFKDDKETIYTSTPGALHPRQHNVLSSRTEEEQLIEAMKTIGTVYTLGKPGEELPDIGAKRIYPRPDEDWKDFVTTCLKNVHAVVIRAGDTEGLWWEFQ